VLTHQRLIALKMGIVGKFGLEQVYAQSAQATGRLQHNVRLLPRELGRFLFLPRLDWVRHRLQKKRDIVGATFFGNLRDQFFLPLGVRALRMVIEK
jgi:hypothetical protein